MSEKSASEISDQFFKYLNLPAADFGVNDNDEKNLSLLKEILETQDINYQIPKDSFQQIPCRNRLEWVLLDTSKQESSKLKDYDFSGNTLLHFAVKKNYDFDVTYLLNRGANFTIKNADGFTPLRLAIHTINSKNGRSCLWLKGVNKNVVANLILNKQVENNDLTNPKCDNGISHFHIACITNHVPAVNIFLKNGVDVNETVNLDSHCVAGYSPLHLAARYCSADTIEVLLNHGADKNVKNAKGRTPLQILVKFKLQLFLVLKKNVLVKDKWFDDTVDKIDACINLLICSDEKDFSQPISDDTGLSKLHLACLNLNNKLDENYLKQCTNINVQVNLDSPVCPGYTPLHFAAHSNIDAFILLLNQGANIAINDKESMSPLSFVTDFDDIRKVLSTQSSLIDIQFSDGDKVRDVIDYITSISAFKTYLHCKENVNVQILRDSPVWPGYTILHLVVLFAGVREGNPLMICQKLDYFKKIDYCTEGSRISRHFSEIIQLCIDHGIDFGKQDANGSTPLHIAAYFVDGNSIDLMLCKYKDNLRRKANPRDCYNLSHFDIVLTHTSQELMKRELVRSFVKSGSELNIIVKCNHSFSIRRRGIRTYFSLYKLDAGLTPLHIAIYDDDLILVNLMLELGADPLMKSSDGLTPLHFAFFYSKIQCITLLLENARVLEENAIFEEGLSHFHIACYAEQDKAAELYLKLGADVNAPITCKKNPLKICKSRFSYFGYTPLHLAAETHSYDLVVLLLKNGADLRAKNAEGLTPIDLLLNAYISTTVPPSLYFPEDAEKILNHLYFDDLKLSYEIESKFGLQLLHLACCMTDLELVKKLLKSGVDVNARVSKDMPITCGFAPMHFALWMWIRKKELVKPIVDTLLEHGAHITTPDSLGRTPIHIAHYFNQEDAIVNMLLNRITSYDINPTDNSGISHFHIACSRNNVKVVQQFLEHGVDVNKKTYFFLQNDARFSPLQYAVTRKCKEVVDLLLERGADTTVKDKNGTTLLTFAVAAYDGKDSAIDIIQSLLSKTAQNINVKNNNHVTPLYALFLKMIEDQQQRSCSRAKEKDLEVMRMLISYGAQVNFYADNVGVLGEMLKWFYKDKNNIFDVVLNTATDLASVDPHSGRNVFHNLVSTDIPISHSGFPISKRYVTEHGYADVIGKLGKRGYKLEHQDHEGRTALHVAATIGNCEAVAGLLAQGANVNIVDNKCETPLHLCEILYDDKSNFNWVHYRVCTEKLLWHIHKMFLLELDVNPLNKLMYKKLYPTMASRKNWTDKSCFNELNSMEEMVIFDTFTLRDVLNGNTVSRYSSMTEKKRVAIDTFFENNPKLHETHPNFAGLARLQYRAFLANRNAK